MGRLRGDWMALVRKRAKGRTFKETVRRGRDSCRGYAPSLARRFRVSGATDTKGGVPRAGASPLRPIKAGRPPLGCQGGMRGV